MQIKHHRIVESQYIASPNANARPHGQRTDLIVIHCISLPPGVYTGDSVIRLFTNTLDPAEHPDFADLAGLRVSSHLFIRRDGTLIQFVPFDRRAWHAGKSKYQRRSNCNDFSIGIELEGVFNQPFAPKQYTVLAEAVRSLLAHYPDLSAERITRHSDIAPLRKKDPGPGFDRHFLAHY